MSPEIAAAERCIEAIRQACRTIDQAVGIVADGDVYARSTLAMYMSEWARELDPAALEFVRERRH